MKTKSHSLLMAFALFALAAINSQLSTALAQGTAFTYQGRLLADTNGANGLYDFQFSLSNAPSDGGQVGSTVTITAVGVTNGLFTAVLDFGAVFTGNATWLGIGVRTNGVGGYTGVGPTQQLTAEPYAIYAGNAANLSGTVSSANVSGTYGNAVNFNNAGNSFSGNGAGLANVNASSVGGLSAVQFWQTAGNTGTTAGPNFVGTADNQPLEAHVNGQRALRLEPTTNSPNVILGWNNNAAGSGVVGAAIGGGGASLAVIPLGGGPSPVSAAFFGQSNLVYDSFGTIAGGLGNQILPLGQAATIGGGLSNTITGGGGPSATGGTIAGGVGNVLNGYSVGLSGDEFCSTISGGSYNDIFGGAVNATIGGGQSNVIASSTSAATIGGGLNNLIDTASYGTIGGGYGNTVSYLSYESTIGGGSSNTIGLEASLGTTGATIAGGADNAIQPDFSYSTIGGGYSNSMQGYSVSGPIYACTIAGGLNNQIDERMIGSSIGGGGFNLVESNATLIPEYNTIAGGDHNVVNGQQSCIGGGFGNSSSGLRTTVAGGADDHATNAYDAVCGGADNIAGGSRCFIGGGSGNHALGLFAMIGGGEDSSATSDHSMIVGGGNNSVSGSYAFSAGHFANATNNGSFVWSDNSGSATASFTTNQFMARASGGVVLLSSTAASPLSYATGSAGVALQPNATSWSTVSDRNAKKNFQSLDSKAVLDKLAAMPIQRWNYKWEKDGDVPNIGPMAQDFKAAFYPGRDDKSISTLEFDGVELAAIQGLNEKLEQQTKDKDAELQDLKARLEKLERLMNQKNGGAR